MCPLIQNSHFHFGHVQSAQHIHIINANISHNYDGEKVRTAEQNVHEIVVKHNDMPIRNPDDHHESNAVRHHIAKHATAKSYESSKIFATHPRCELCFWFAQLETIH